MLRKKTFDPELILQDKNDCRVRKRKVIGLNISFSSKFVLHFGPFLLSFFFP